MSALNSIIYFDKVNDINDVVNGACFFRLSGLDNVKEIVERGFITKFEIQKLIEIDTKIMPNAVGPLGIERFYFVSLSHAYCQWRFFGKYRIFDEYEALRATRISSYTHNFFFRKDACGNPIFVKFNNIYSSFNFLNMFTIPSINDMLEAERRIIENNNNENPLAAAELEKRRWNLSNNK